MCEPATIAYIGLAITAASAAVQYDASKKQGEYAEDVADYNAKVGEQQAQESEKVGNINEQAQRTRVRQMIGAQRAAMGVSGADVGVGSFDNIISDTAYMGEIDAQTIRANAAKEAWGYRTGADMTRRQGQMAQAAGNMNATGTLLTAAGQTFGTASQLRGRGSTSSGATFGNASPQPRGGSYNFG